MTTKPEMQPTIDCPMFREITTMIYTAPTGEAADKAIELLREFVDSWLTASMLEAKLEVMKAGLSQAEATLAALKAVEIEEDETHEEYLERTLLAYLEDLLPERQLCRFENNEITWGKLRDRHTVSLIDIQEDLGVVIESDHNFHNLSFSKMIVRLDSMYYEQNPQRHPDADEDDDEEDKPKRKKSKAKKSKSN